MMEKQNQLNNLIFKLVNILSDHIDNGFEILGEDEKFYVLDGYRKMVTSLYDFDFSYFEFVNILFGRKTRLRRYDETLGNNLFMKEIEPLLPDHFKKGEWKMVSYLENIIHQTVDLLFVDNLDFLYVRDNQTNKCLIDMKNSDGKILCFSSDLSIDVFDPLAFWTMDNIKKCKGKQFISMNVESSHVKQKNNFYVSSIHMARHLAKKIIDYFGLHEAYKEFRKQYLMFFLSSTDINDPLISYHIQKENLNIEKMKNMNKIKDQFNSRDTDDMTKGLQEMFEKMILQDASEEDIGSVKSDPTQKSSNHMKEKSKSNSSNNTKSSKDQEYIPIVSFTFENIDTLNKKDKEEKSKKTITNDISNKKVDEKNQQQKKEKLTRHQKKCKRKILDIELDAIHHARQKAKNKKEFNKLYNDYIIDNWYEIQLLNNEILDK